MRRGLSADEPGRDGIFDHPDCDHRGSVDSGGEYQPGVEAFQRQRREEGLFGGEVFADRSYPVVDPAPLVLCFPDPDSVVELIQGLHLRHRPETVPSEPSNLTLNTALLVSPCDSWLAVKGIKIEGRFEQNPPLVLNPLAALPEHHGRDGGGQVVIPDVFRWNAADFPESLDMPFKESFLRLCWIDPMDGAARSGQTEYEHVAFRLHPVQHDPDFTEINLGLRAWCMFLRHKHLDPTAGFDINLRPTNPDVIAHRGIRQILRCVLLDQPGKDSLSGVALLPGCRRVLNQHRVDR